MSAGVQDAVNLGWKLALDIKGQAPEGLLDTYHAERHPVGARILTNTLAQRILYLGGDEITPMREVLAELMGAHESVQRHLAGMVTGLDIRHDVAKATTPCSAGACRTGNWSSTVRRPRSTRCCAPHAPCSWNSGATTACAPRPPAGPTGSTSSRPSSTAARPRGRHPRPPRRLRRLVAGLGAGPDGLTAALGRWFGPSA